MGNQSVVQFGDNFSPDDLQQFYSTFVPELQGDSVTVYGVNRPSGRILGEANLDTQYVSSVGAKIATFDYGLTQTSDPAGMLEWAYQVGNDSSAPLVHSISYGEYGGSYDNQTVQQFSYELMVLGLRGITVTLASGDNGVGCNKRSLCGIGSVEQEFDFPSAPYITMVGATQLQKDGSEEGATLSSGGFSKDYYRPSWQSEAVESYLEKLGKGVPSPPESFYAEGRGYPDVAAIGENVQVVIDGTVSFFSGWS